MTLQFSFSKKFVWLYLVVLDVTCHDCKSFLFHCRTSHSAFRLYACILFAILWGMPVCNIRPTSSPPGPDGHPQSGGVRSELIWQQVIAWSLCFWSFPPPCHCSWFIHAHFKPFLGFTGLLLTSETFRNKFSAPSLHPVHCIYFLPIQIVAHEWYRIDICAYAWSNIRHRWKYCKIHENTTTCILQAINTAQSWPIDLSTHLLIFPDIPWLHQMHNLDSLFAFLVVWCQPPIDLAILTSVLGKVFVLRAHLPAIRRIHQLQLIMQKPSAGNPSCHLRLQVSKCQKLLRMFSTVRWLLIYIFYLLTVVHLDWPVSPRRPSNYWLNNPTWIGKSFRRWISADVSLTCASQMVPLICPIFTTPMQISMQPFVLLATRSPSIPKWLKTSHVMTYQHRLRQLLSWVACPQPRT